MVSKKCALFAVVIAAFTSAVISNLLLESRRQAMLSTYRSRVNEQFSEEFQKGWDAALTSPSTVSEAYKKLFLKHQ